MTAAGMSMHMAMANARAAANRKSTDDQSDNGPLWLTDGEIKEIRLQSGKDDSENPDSVPSAETELEDPNPLPKCSFCCTVM